jgi:Ca2+-binding RTX toxin-like protein
MPGRWISRSVVALALVVTGVGAAPGPAAADHLVTTAYVSGDILHLFAGEGVANRVTLSPTSSGHTYVEDAGNELRLDPARAGGCHQREFSGISCPPTVARVIAYLGDGDDYFANYSNLFVDIHGDAGDDDLWGWFPNESFHGGDGDDALYGLSGADTLSGDAGEDVLEGFNGNDTIYGGADDDIIRGEDGNDTLSGDGGVNEVFGGRGQDKLYSRGKDQVRGEDDDDTLYHWAHNSTSDYYGGPGTDTIRYDIAGVATGFNISLNDVADDGPTIYQLYRPHNIHSDVERVVGSPYVDRIHGSDLPNTLTGGAGDDTIEGRGGDDVIDAQQGAGQRVSGGDGRDRCAGQGLIPDASCEQIG